MPKTGDRNSLAERTGGGATLLRRGGVGALVRAHCGGTRRGRMMSCGVTPRTASPPGIQQLKHQRLTGVLLGAAQPGPAVYFLCWTRWCARHHWSPPLGGSAGPAGPSWPLPRVTAGVGCWLGSLGPPAGGHWRLGDRTASPWGLLTAFQGESRRTLGPGLEVASCHAL